MPKRRTAAQSAASRNNLKKARAARKFNAPATGPGSVAWAKSSILFRSGQKQADKSKIVNIYPPKDFPENISPYFNSGAKSGRLKAPLASPEASKKLRTQYISFLKGHSLRNKGHKRRAKNA